MACKDCIHHEVCKEDNTALCGYALVESTAENCDYFKDKSRFIELPCEVGDTVYIIRDKVKACDVVYIGLSADEKCNHVNFSEYYADGKFMKTHSVGFSEIGRYVFLAREEAEKVLKEREENAEVH